jgi:pyruvate-ferredoxin/flavodoxin oxidoreductase
MSGAQAEMKRAVESGYWHLYRFNPLNKEHPFTLDSKKPSSSFQDFLKGETRYSSLERSFPENAKALFAQAEIDAKEKYNIYTKMQGGQWEE